MIFVLVPEVKVRVRIRCIIAFIHKRSTFMWVCFNFLNLNKFLQEGSLERLKHITAFLSRDNHSSAAEQHVQQPLPELCI